MCFLSAGPRWRNLNSDVWRWASVTQCFLGFFGFLLVSPVEFVAFSDSFLPEWAQLRSHESLLPHGAGQGVTVLEPSSHCVHPLNFHLRMRAILRLSPLKINPQTRRGCDVEESRCGKLSYASPHVKIRQMWHTAHWITQTSAASFQRCEVSHGGGGVASLPLFHTLTPLPGLDSRSRKAKCSQLACRIQPRRTTGIRRPV